MAYVITNDRNYLKMKDNKSWGSCTKIDQAYQYTSFGKAINAVTNLPKTFKNLGYHVMEIHDTVEENQVDNEQSSMVIQTHKEDGFDDSMPDFYSILDTFKDFEAMVDVILNNRKYLEAKLVTIDAEIQDILHAVEFYTYNACDGFKMYKKLHEARVRRRRIKDSLIMVETVESILTPDYFNSKPTARMIGLMNRKYKVRNDRGLFKDE